MANQCDAIKVSIKDSVSHSITEVDITYDDGTSYGEEFSESEFTFNVKNVPIVDAFLTFMDDVGEWADVVVLSVSYLKGGKSVGSSLIQYQSMELKLLKYKVELPRGAKVTLFDDAAMEAKYLAWNIPCPTSFPNMTYLQVKAANGREAQINPSAGPQTIELFTELGRRYAVFGEIWTYSFEQVLWFADLRVQLSDDSWQNCIPTAGEGGTIVTALPQ